MPASQGNQWQNWSGEIQCHPQIIDRPHSTDDLVQSVKEYRRKGLRIRVAGSGHSCVPLVQTNEVLISLENLSGIESIDVSGQTVTVMGGTILTELGHELFKHGLAQENLGDIDVQSVAGAISTGTHGTGVHFGTLSTQIEQLTIITASGDVLECSPEHDPDIFAAAQVSLGTLGIISKVKLRVVPAKLLHYRSYRMHLTECLAHLEQYKGENDYFGFYWIPYTPWVQVKFFNGTSAPPTTASFWDRSGKPTLKNGLHWLLSESCRVAPMVSKRACAIAGMTIASEEEINYSHKVLTFPPRLPFHEMEYALSADYAAEVIEKITKRIEQHQFKVHYPLQCRFVKADNTWLSPAYQRESVYLAVHMYKGMRYQEYFQCIEEIFKQYQGRPHWGKMHTTSVEEFAQLYPRWDDFQRIRAQLDPEGIFLNDYLCQLFHTTV